MPNLFESAAWAGEILARSMLDLEPEPLTWQTGIIAAARVVAVQSLACWYYEPVAADLRTIEDCLCWWCADPEELLREVAILFFESGLRLALTKLADAISGGELADGRSQATNELTNSIAIKDWGFTYDRTAVLRYVPPVIQEEFSRLAFEAFMRAVNTPKPKEK
jgi:hypothetical protein